ncbi:MAG: hypothetical protein AAB263_14695 [Planctomycetota bacterium]
MILRWLSVLLLAITGTAGEVRISVSCPWHDQDGYTPALVRIEALVRPITVSVTVSIGNSSARDVITVDPSTPVLRTILIPPDNGHGSGYVQVQWSSDREQGDANTSATIDYRAAALIALDPNEQLPLPQLQKFVAEHIHDTSGWRGGRYRSGSPAKAERTPADSLPDRWQGWPTWLTLLTTQTGEALLTPAQREAIVTWTHAGGALFVTDAVSLKNWQRLGARVTRIAIESADDPALRKRLLAASQDRSDQNEYKVPGTDQMPIGLFLTLAITFAVVAGPLNIWFVRRRGKPHLLLITTPLISAGTCLLLIIIALVADGLGKQRSVIQIVVLDQHTQRCIGFNGITWFCGLAPGEFTLDQDDRAVPIDHNPMDWRSRREAAHLSLDWRSGQVAGSEWIPARINRQLAITQSRPERRRMTLTPLPSGKGWRVGNGLATRIDALQIVDASGVAWALTGLEPGEQRDLTQPMSRPGSISYSDALRRCGLDAHLATAELGVQPGTFIAKLHTPLLPIPGPTAVDAEPPQAWLAGVLDPAVGSATTPEGF